MLPRSSLAGKAVPWEQGKAGLGAGPGEPRGWQQPQPSSTLWIFLETRSRSSPCATHCQQCSSTHKPSTPQTGQCQHTPNRAPLCPPQEICPGRGSITLSFTCLPSSAQSQISSENLILISSWLLFLLETVATISSHVVIHRQELCAFFLFYFFKSCC